MAFKFEVAEFCDGCGYFEADVMKFQHCKNLADVESDHISKYTDTYISCKNLAHCKKIRGEKVDAIADNAHHMNEVEMKSALEKLCAKFNIEVDLVNTELSTQEASIYQQMLDLEFEGEK